MGETELDGPDRLNWFDPPKIFLQTMLNTVNFQQGDQEIYDGCKEMYESYEAQYF